MRLLDRRSPPHDAQHCRTGRRSCERWRSRPWPCRCGWPIDDRRPPAPCRFVRRLSPPTATRRPLWRCHVTGLGPRMGRGDALRHAQAVVAGRQFSIASAWKAFRVLRETRWRWVLKVLWAVARADRNRWADPGDLNRCIFRSRRRVGWCEFSARLFRRCPWSWQAERRSWRMAAP